MPMKKAVKNKLHLFQEKPIFFLVDGLQLSAMASMFVNSLPSSLSTVFLYKGRQDIPAIPYAPM